MTQGIRFFQKTNIIRVGLKTPPIFAKQKLDISIFRFTRKSEIFYVPEIEDFCGFYSFNLLKSQDDMMGVRTFSGLVAKLKMLGRMQWAV